MAEAFVRWADMGASRRRAADAELLDALGHLRAENSVRALRRPSLLAAPCFLSAPRVETTCG